jgi:hypothetical protein
MVVGLDEKNTQHTGSAVDLHSSLILIEASDESADVLPLLARRIRHQLRLSDSVLLLEKRCALVFPATPFSGVQVVMNRVSVLLAQIPCEQHAYHGTTALLLLERMREAGARSIPFEECTWSSSAVCPHQKRAASHAEVTGAPTGALPYLACLTTYPPPRLLHLFPYELACRYQCIPVGAERKILTLATCQRLTREIVGQLRLATSRDIFQVRCEMTMIDEVLHYWRRLQEETEVVEEAGQRDEISHRCR